MGTTGNTLQPAKVEKRAERVFVSFKEYLPAQLCAPLRLGLFNE